MATLALYRNRNDLTPALVVGSLGESPAEVMLQLADQLGVSRMSTPFKRINGAILSAAHANGYLFWEWNFMRPAEQAKHAPFAVRESYPLVNYSDDEI